MGLFSGGGGGFVSSVTNAVSNVAQKAIQPIAKAPAVVSSAGGSVARQVSTIGSSVGGYAQPVVQGLAAMPGMVVQGQNYLLQAGIAGAGGALQNPALWGSAATAGLGAVTGGASLAGGLGGLFGGGGGGQQAQYSGGGGGGFSTDGGYQPQAAGGFPTWLIAAGLGVAALFAYLFDPREVTMLPVQSILIPLPASGAAGNSWRVDGNPAFFEYLGNERGDDLEVSLDNSTWFRLAPGKILNNLTGVATVYTRNPYQHAANFYVTYGSGAVLPRRPGVMNRDGSHPVTKAFESDNTIIPQAIFDFNILGAMFETVPAIKDIIAYNNGAAVAYLKLYRQLNAIAGVPTVGVTPPILTLPIAAHSPLVLNTTTGIDSRISSLPCYQMHLAFTGGDADADVALVPAAQVRALINLC